MFLVQRTSMMNRKMKRSLIFSSTGYVPFSCCQQLAGCLHVHVGGVAVVWEEPNVQSLSHIVKGLPHSLMFCNIRVHGQHQGRAGPTVFGCCAGSVWGAFEGTQTVFAPVFPLAQSPCAKRPCHEAMLRFLPSCRPRRRVFLMRARQSCTSCVLRAFMPK